MTFLGFLLLFLFSSVHGEEAEPVFHAEGSAVEMGYCFGVDYIVVFRSTLQGDQLLGNSSDDDAALSPPAELSGRININRNEQPLGLQIKNLTRTDSGTYRRECWQNQTLASQHTMDLLVCDEEVESKEISVTEQDGGAELRCSSISTDLEGTSLRWYHEISPSYKVTLFLDTSMSLEPLDELLGPVEVRNRGEVLWLEKSILKPNQYFYCLVVKDAKCLSFQRMYLPDRSEGTDVFASEGDMVVLKCPSDGANQRWKTPLGIMNSSSETGSQMKIPYDEESEDFSLVISAVSDKHSGEYSCLSSSLEMQYSLVLCPKKQSQEKAVFLAQDVSLDCDVDERDSYRVLWHRLDPSGGYELIHDSVDETVTIPQDLRGRLTLSENSSLMTILNLAEKDLGTYWCVVAEGPRFLDGVEYTGDYGGDYSGEGEHGDEQHWHDSRKCFFKQKTFLSLATDLKTVTITAVTNDPEMNVKDPQRPAHNVKASAVGAGLVCLLVVMAVVLAIVIKRKRKLSRSGRNESKNIKANVDPDCTQRLTNSNGSHD